jgi:hypothetical protein
MFCYAHSGLVVSVGDSIPGALPQADMFCSVGATDTQKSSIELGQEKSSSQRISSVEIGPNFMAE